MKKRIIRLVVLLLIMCTFALSDRGLYAAEQNEDELPKRTNVVKTPDKFFEGYKQLKKPGHWESEIWEGEKRWYWQNNDGSRPKRCWIMICCRLD